MTVSAYSTPVFCIETTCCTGAHFYPILVLYATNKSANSLK